MIYVMLDMFKALTDLPVSCILTFSITYFKLKTSLDNFLYISNVLDSSTILHFNQSSSSVLRLEPNMATKRITLRGSTSQIAALCVASEIERELSSGLSWPLTPVPDPEQLPSSRCFFGLFGVQWNLAKVKCNLQLPWGFYTLQTIVFNKLLRL